MTSTAIIAEYNPFHNGHKFHLRSARKSAYSDFIFAVMSSSFVQRGEAAVYDKWTRTRAALRGGVDMVIELPVIYSTASAENFARGAVKIISASGIADTIAFGAESDNLSALSDAAEILLNPTDGFTGIMKSELSKGMSFPSARATAFSKETGNNPDILSTSNNILAIEYLKALKIFSSDIKPVIIKRTGADYNSDKINGSIASASAVRKVIYKGRTDLITQAVPPECFDIYEKSIPIFMDSFSDAIAYLLRTMPADSLREISGITEGLENRILKTVGSSYKITDICAELKTKRYTLTRLMRIMCHILLRITKKDEEYFSPMVFEPYIRVLGFRKSAESLVSKLCHSSSVPVIMNVNKDERNLSVVQKSLLDMEKKATDIYFMGLPTPSAKKRGLDYTMPVIIENL
ncbi:hypothetical protein IMSAG049_00268 [Clostridiales bacterium]|nr:hypothetical protein IMSAG049_00268 [Clostridiales bacterium]